MLTPANEIVPGWSGSHTTIIEASGMLMGPHGDYGLDVGSLSVVLAAAQDGIAGLYKCRYMAPCRAERFFPDYSRLSFGFTGDCILFWSNNLLDSRDRALQPDHFPHQPLTVDLVCRRMSSRCVVPFVAAHITKKL